MASVISRKSPPRWRRCRKPVARCCGIGAIAALADFKRRNPAMTLRIEATHQYADFNASRVDVAVRYGREHSTGLKFEPLVEVRGLPVCAPALIKGGLRSPEDLSREVLIHLTSQPRAWPVWLKEAGI